MRSHRRGPRLPERRPRGRAAHRLVAGLIGLAVAATFGAATLASCGTDAVGIEACREIEDARCDASAACGMNAQQILDCKNFYHDQCLHGLENVTENDAGGPSQGEIGLCVGAVKSLGNCIHAGGTTMADCSGSGSAVLLSPGVDPMKSACEVLQHEPEDLAACLFIVEPADAGLDSIIPDVIEEDVFIL